MDKREEHWEIPRIPENAWLFKPNFDVNEEEEFAEKKKLKRKNKRNDGPTQK